MFDYFKKTDEPRRDFCRASVIVLLFMAAHGIACYLTHDIGLGDGLFLTFLTVAMVFSLVRFYDIPLELFLGLAFLACFAGYYIGLRGAEILLGRYPELGTWGNVIVTVFVTGLIGMIIVQLLSGGRKVIRRK